MTIVKRGGRYKAVLKQGREYVGSRTFDTKRDAQAWLTRERAALAGGVDVRAGKERVRVLIPRWLDARSSVVAKKTLTADKALTRLMPTWLSALSVSAVSQREVARSFEALLSDGLSESSVTRYRASLSAFFGWCVREKYIVANPIDGVRVPKQSNERIEMRPWTEDGLESAFGNWTAKDEHLAKVLLVLGWTGLRWGEARAVLVGDVMEVPTPGLLVRRSAPEGVGTKSTKGRRSRRVPLADRVLPLVRQFAEGKNADNLLLTTARGSRLHRTPVLRSVDWKRTGEGRRLHDLRHTAACLWLSRGVDPGTVQAWMGHESIATTNGYLHFLGTSADLAGLERLNDERGYHGGTKRGRDDESHA